MEEFEANNCEPSLHDPVEYRFQLLRTWRRKLGSKATNGHFLCCLKRCLPTDQTFLEDTQKLIIAEHSVPTIASVENEISSCELQAIPIANSLLQISIENQKKFTRWTHEKQKVHKRTILQLKRESRHKVKSLSKLVEKLKKEKENLQLEKEAMVWHLEEKEGEIEFLKAENKYLNNELMSVTEKPPEYCPIKAKEEEQESDSENSFDFEDGMKLSDGIKFVLDTS